MHNKIKIVAALVIGIALGGAGVGIAAIPDSTSKVISACVRSGGWIRVVDYQAGRRCTKYETALSWNQTGPVGPTGPQGSVGPQGQSGVTTNCLSYPHADIDWHGCDLHGANLTSQNLSGADLTGANLSGVNFTNANLSGANFTNADLTGATMTGAVRADTIWGNTVCPDGSNSAVTPNCMLVEAISEQFSSNPIALNSNPNVYWTIALHDPLSQLPEVIGARLCPPGSTSPHNAFCTGALLYRNGTPSDASYTALFIISAGAPTGEWLPYYWFGSVSRWGTSRLTVS